MPKNKGAHKSSVSPRATKIAGVARSLTSGRPSAPNKGPGSKSGRNK